MMRMPFFRLVGMAALFLALLMSQAFAGEAAPLAANPAAEKRLQALSEDLRCLVCQNQSIADSHADLALDLKREIRTMISRGKSDQEIVDFMVARYGDFVRYKPPFKASTLLLWGGPVLLLLTGFAVLFRQLRRRNSEPALTETALDPAELARAQALLGLDAKENTVATRSGKKR